MIGHACQVTGVALFRPCGHVCLFGILEVRDFSGSAHRPITESPASVIHLQLIPCSGVLYSF